MGNKGCIISLMSINLTKEEILTLSKDDLIVEIYSRLIDKIDMRNLSTNQLRKLLMEMCKV